MATADEIRELLALKDGPLRSERIAELAAREPVHKIACRHCYCLFVPIRKDQRFCSSKCRVANFKAAS